MSYVRVEAVSCPVDGHGHVTMAVGDRVSWKRVFGIEIAAPSTGTVEGFLVDMFGNVIEARLALDPCDELLAAVGMLDRQWADKNRIQKDLGHGGSVSVRGDEFERCVQMGLLVKIAGHGTPLRALKALVDALPKCNCNKEPATWADTWLNENTGESGCGFQIGDTCHSGQVARLNNEKDWEPLPWAEALRAAMVMLRGSHE